MEAVRNENSISVEEYLDGERSSEIRHEYIGGLVYAMPGTSERHNTICQNLLIALRAHLRDKPCRILMESVKLRLQEDDSEIFYYPDLMITCDPRDKDQYFKRYPKVLMDVLSPDTARIDRQEKFKSYSGIDTLEEYVLVAQETKEVTVFRRSNQWRPEIISDSAQKLSLPSLNFSVELSAIYEGI